ncbi:MAG: hypothetical protein ACMUIE_09005 [Thermoplasmatota archaeon]
MPDKNLDRLEARIWTSYFQDGVWDIFLGAMMLTMALRTFVDHWIVSIAFFPLVVGMILVKRFVTARRLGYVKFSKRRRRKRIAMFLVILSANVITLALLIVGMFGVDPSVSVRVAVIGGLVFLSFSAVAYFLDFFRFFIWGALFTLAVIATEVFGMEMGSYLFLGFGSTAVLVGIAYFIAFLRKYPGEKGVPMNG